MSKITHGYYISAVALHQNNLLREVEIDSYVGGKKKRVVTSASMDTFCLLSFLKFFSHADKRKTIRDGGHEYTWLSYQYAIDKNPILKLNNAKIKRHLDILQALDLLDLVSDRGQVYFSLKNYELTELANHNQAVINNNQGSVVNHNQGAIMNNNSRINNIDRVENIKRIDSTRTQCASERSLSKSHLKAYSKRYTNEEIDSAFESFWLKYPKKENKQEAKKAYINALNGVYTARSLPRSTPISIEELQSAVEAYSKHLEATGKLGDKSFLPNATTWLNNQRYDNAYNNPPTNGREAIAQFNQQNGLRGDSAVKGYYNLPRHMQEDIEGNWRDFMPKTEEERKANELAVKRALGLEDEE